jgi:L-arabinose isomerase
MPHPAKPRVAILALTLELYERLVPGLRERREQWVRDALIPTLSQTADVSFDRAACRRDQIDAAVAGCETRGVDALLVVCLTYSPSQIALPALSRTRLPILVWNTQELAAVDSSFDVAKMIDNHGVHGTQDLCNTLLRGGVPFEYLTFHPAEREGWRRLGDFLTAASAAAGVRRARVGLIGYPFPGMGDFAVDTTHLAATLGTQWTPLSVEEYVQRSASAPADAVDATVGQYRAAYDLAGDLTDDDLAATARAELALRGMVAESRLDAITFQFMAFGEDERTETLPFVAASRLLAEGVGFAGEGDVVGAIGTWLLGRLQPPASFSEIFTIDFAGNGLLMSHMGEINVAMARRDRKPPLVARPTPIARTRARQLAIPASLEPGPATLCALAQGPGGRWRLIAGRVRIDDFGPLPSMCVPHFKIVPDGDVREWLTAYAKAGGPHHNAVCFGDATPRVRAVARLLNADYCEIS